MDKLTESYLIYYLKKIKENTMVNNGIVKNIVIASPNGISRIDE